VIVAYLPLRFTEIAPYKYLIFGLALVVIMIWRAQGILPARQRLLTYGREAYARVVKGNRQPRVSEATAEEGAEQ
jgi:branched-chain amino acid transport system permease protein